MPKKRTLQRTKADESQTVLSHSLKPEQRVVPPKVQVITEWLNPTYLCPFCLHEGPMSDYEFKTPKGKVSKRKLCPDCNNSMLERTLTTEMTVNEYALFVFNYALSGFWEKVNYSKFCERLRKLGISYEFWKKYKELKGAGYMEEEKEHFEQQQEEWAREKGYIK
jgi:hypothetical protein